MTTTPHHVGREGEVTASHVATITVRQREVIEELMRDGAPDVTIGRRLGIGHEAVGTHLRKIYKAAREAGATCNSREELIVGLFRGRIRLNVVNGQERAK